jgi:hypothetical protein
MKRRLAARSFPFALARSRDGAAHLCRLDKREIEHQPMRVRTDRRAPVAVSIPSP